jgi:hypothetical protein
MAFRDMTPQGAPGHGHEHEKKDASIRGIVLFAVILTAVAVVIHLGLLGWLEAFRAEERRQDRNRPELFADETGQFPNPRLQDNPARDMMQLTEEELTRLDRYGWVEPGKVAHIPIGRAMELVAAEGPEEDRSSAEGPAQADAAGPRPSAEPTSPPEGKPDAGEGANRPDESKDKDDAGSKDEPRPND